MNNETHFRNNNWLKRNWLWVLFSSIIIIATLFSTSLFMNGNIAYLTLVNSDPSIYESALKEANKNSKVIQTFGNLRISDKPSLYQGTAVFSNDNKRIDVTVEVIGEKKNGKIFVVVKKIKDVWDFNNITVQNNKNTKDVIIVK